MGRKSKDAPQPYDLRPLVVEAVAESAEPLEGIFDAIGFAAVVKGHFGLRLRPRGDWCRDVLSKLDYLEPCADGYRWRYRPEGTTSGGPR